MLRKLPRPTRRHGLFHSFRPVLEELESRLVPSGTVLTYHNDLAGTGTNPNETTLTPANVSAATFGKRFTTPVDGMVFAQPLFVAGVNITTGPNPGVHDIVFAATEHDSLYAIDAASGQVLWQDHFLTGLPGATVTPVPSNAVNSTGVGPEVGITGTPVIDGSTQTLYVVAATQEVVGGNNHYVQRLHAVSLADGRERTGAPTVIADTSFNGGVYTYNSGPSVNGTGDGAVAGKVTYNALRQLQRAALTLANGTVYVASAAHNGDITPYHGWVLGFDAASLQLKAAFNTTPNGSDGGIWQAGGGVTVDPQGFLYVETGNGTFDATLDGNGFPNKGDYGDSVVKLVVDPASGPTSQNGNGWGLKAVDYFTPFNQAALESKDQDLGSQSPVVLPDAAGNAQHPHLLVAAGKEGKVYLIDRDNMGRYNAGGTTDNVVQTLSGVGSVFGTPAFFNNTLYYVTPGAHAKAFAVTNAAIAATPTSQSPDSFAYPGSTPSVSSNGGTTGIVWDLDKGTGELRAYAAGNYATELYTTAQAAGNRDALGTLDTFAVPTVAGGRVFVGTSNALVGYGLLAAAPPAPTGVTATQAGSSGVFLRWTASPGATSYNVYRATASGGEGATPVATGDTGTTYSDTGLAGGATYYYQVSAVGAGGESGRSAEASVNLLAANEHFVQALYGDFLGRSGSVAELDGWVKVLPTLGAGGVAAGIEHSPESAHRLATSYYARFLGRAPVGGEDSFWANLLAQPATTQEQVITGFLGSAEFASHADALIGSSNHDNNFVLSLYSLLLHRTGSAVRPDESNFWLAALPARGHADVAAVFLASREFRSDAVRTFYSDPSLPVLPNQPFLPELLHRTTSVNPDDVQYWANSPLDLFGIEAGFAASKEFFDQP